MTFEDFADYAALKQALLAEREDQQDEPTGSRSAVLQSRYLLFGGSEEYAYGPWLDAKETLQGLAELGFGNSPLSEARVSARRLGSDELHLEAERYCDFCGKPLTGVAYDRLHDGRERCLQCTQTVVHGVDDYNQLYNQVRSDMATFFGILLPAGVDVRIKDAEQIAKDTSAAWTPTEGFDAREAGIVKKRWWARRPMILLENGYPRVPLMSTIASCLTYVWQQKNWDEKELRKKYADRYEEVWRGMAAWVGIQYLYLANESGQAERARTHLMEHNDIIGEDSDAPNDAQRRGLLSYIEQYPLSEGLVLVGDTPFRHPTEPLKL